MAASSTASDTAWGRDAPRVLGRSAGVAGCEQTLDDLEIRDRIVRRHGYRSTGAHCGCELLGLDAAQIDGLHRRGVLETPQVESVELP